METKRVRMLKYHRSGAVGILLPGRDYDLPIKDAEQIVRDFPDRAQFTESMSPENRMITPAPRKRRKSG